MGRNGLLFLLGGNPRVSEDGMSKLLEELEALRPSQDQFRQDKDRQLSETGYWIARALLEVAEQLVAIRFELSGPKG